MSASDKDIDKQARRHWGPLAGMAIVVLFALGLILYWIFEEAQSAGPPEGADVQIDGRTGEPTGEPAAAEGPAQD